MIDQHLDGETVVATVGGLLTDAECLMLSKVLTRLSNSGGSKQEGRRGILSGAVGRPLCAPEAAQTPVAAHPRPVPGLAHRGTTAASSQTLLLKGLALSQAADVAVNRLGVVSPGRVVPCSR